VIWPPEPFRVNQRVHMTPAAIGAGLERSLGRRISHGVVVGGAVSRGELFVLVQRDGRKTPQRYWPGFWTGCDCVSGAGLTEAGVPPLTLVSPGTPSEPSASPAAETLGGGAGATPLRTIPAGEVGEMPPSVLQRAASNEGRPEAIDSGHGASEQVVAPVPAPDEPSTLPARPHGGPEDQAGAAAPALLFSYPELIVCPQCERKCVATVERYEGDPWMRFVHVCEHCAYVILESEWNQA
jgi:hypothetical protein